MYAIMYAFIYNYIQTCTFMYGASLGLASYFFVPTFVGVERQDRSFLKNEKFKN